MNLQHQHSFKKTQGLGPYLCIYYKWDWSVLMKNKELNMEKYITGMLKNSVTEGYLMEGDA